MYIYRKRFSEFTILFVVRYCVKTGLIVTFSVDDFSRFSANFMRTYSCINTTLCKQFTFLPWFFICISIKYLQLTKSYNKTKRFGFDL